MRGTFFGSEATRAAGIREMQDARALRRYKKEHPEQFRGRNRGGNILWIFPRRSQRNGDRDRGHHGHASSHAHSHAHSHSHTHSSGGRHHSSNGRHPSSSGRHPSSSGRHHDSRHGSHRRHGDRHHGHGAYYGESHDGPCLHFHHRVHPHHRGTGTLIAGILTGNRDLKEKGRYLQHKAAKSRRREKHQRKQERRNEAIVLKMDGTLNKNRWWG